jgi:uncharacterized membrane protein YedE/YeeE
LELAHKTENIAFMVSATAGFSISRKWAWGFAHWSLGVVRAVLAWPFLAIGGIIIGNKKKK